MTNEGGDVGRAGAHAVEVDRLEVAYPARRGREPSVVIRDMSFQVDEGEFVTIVGPSGAGKTTLLLAIDGLIEPSGGEVRVKGRRVTGPGPDRAMVFQEFGLLPWRTVLGNVMLGIELGRLDRAQGERRARELIRLVGLAGYEEHHPHQLSGGMRQRVGLARALAVAPDVLLMDEPFGALDAQTRELMGVELSRIWELDRKTVLFVTHDIDEAVYLADRVIVLSANPARVRRVIDVTLPRPRTREVRASVEFLAHREQLASLLFDADASPLQETVG
ncbi:MAG TPA: ABC transporter ATP-binding protein [Solirubrobacteraceae bacterium]|nr:ABC transporter ATP-binding protein [Solirubrobacteraceae bacterium]